MLAVQAIPPLPGGTSVRRTARVRRDRATAEDEHGAPAGDAGGVVHLLRPARRPPTAGDDDPAPGSVDPDGRRARQPGPHASPLQAAARAAGVPGPAGVRLAVDPGHLPVSLGQFQAGTALEAQLLTPALDRVHARMMAKPQDETPPSPHR